MLIFIADTNDLEDIDIFDRGLSLVNDMRKKKIEKYAYNEDKKRSLAAGLLLNYAVKQWEEGAKPLAEPVILQSKTLIEKFDKSYDYEIEILEGGKPVFKDRNNIHFSISHGGCYAVCAISDTNIGVDIEGNRTYSLKVSSRFFSSGENDYINSSDNRRVEADRFFEIWTKKESYCKMTGIGVPKGMNQCIFIDHEGREVIHPELDITSFKVKGYTVTIMEERI